MTAQLESVQRAFADALGDANREPPLAGYLSSEEALIHERLALYRSNLRAHWRAALANAYPVLLALVGEAYFNALAHTYAQAYPSQSGDLNVFGASLPGFIEAYEQDPRFRYFADIARVEWALHVAYFAADVVPFTVQQWSAIDGEALLNAPLIVHPACAAIASNHTIGDIWLAHQAGGVWPDRVDAKACVLIVRPLWRPTIVVQSAAAHAAFIALQNGRTLDEALDAAFGIDPHFDVASQWRTWLSASAIVGVA